jgi:excinuclease ABC subunit A
VELTAAPPLAKNIRHHIEIVVDRLAIHAGLRSRLAEAVENALKLGQGTLIVHTSEPEAEATGRKRSPSRSVAADGVESTIDNQQSTIGSDLLLSAHYACPKCDLSFEQPSPQLFSFNSPQGMCTTCDGMGETFDFDPERIVTDPKKPFLKYAVDPMRLWGRMGRWKRHIYRGVAEHVGFDLSAPWQKLPQKAKDALLYGLGDQHITFEWRWPGGVWRHGGKFEGALADLREKHRRAQSGFVRDYYEKFMRKAVCPTCRGARLNAQAMAVRVGRVNINELSALSIADADRFFDSLQLAATEQTIARDAIREIRARLVFLCDVGLDYLALDRPAPTLSGGESQRIRLASQIGAGLVGVLYVLDEPSIGLHARDNERLLASLCRLRDMGNTVIVVEHDEQTMRAADHIVDFGPGPGVRGGEVVAEGAFDKVMRSKQSVTGRFLRGDEQIEIPAQRRPIVRGARQINPRPSGNEKHRARIDKKRASDLKENGGVKHERRQRSGNKT